MTKGRLEAFGDAVIAIVITIMVLELRAPEGAGFRDLEQLAPRFFSYVLSFVFLAIYWNNHHHLFQSVERVNGSVLWANLHLLFWLSLVPFATAWLGETGLESPPVAVYGGVLIMAAAAYYILVRSLIRLHGLESQLAQAVGSDFKGVVSVFLYALALAMAFRWPALAVVVYVLVAVLWIVPDPRFERA